MANKRQISHAEKFQIIYISIAAAPTRSWIVNAHSFLQCGLHTVTPFQRAIWEGGTQSNLTGEKCDKHYLSQVLKVNSNSDESC